MMFPLTSNSTNVEKCFNFEKSDYGFDRIRVKKLFSRFISENPKKTKRELVAQILALAH